MAYSVTPTFTMTGSRGSERAQLSLACQCATDHSFTNYAFPSANIETLRRGGYCLWKIQTIPGGTPPTDNTDMTLLDSGSVDILGGAGANMIDNATKNEFSPLINGSPSLQPVLSALTLTVSNNAVADATFTINFIFTKE